MTLWALSRTQQARAHWLRALAIYERLQAADAATRGRTLLAELPCPASPQVRALQSRESR